MTDGGRPRCELAEGATFAQFLEAGRADCEFDFGDAGSRAFNVSMTEGTTMKKKHAPEPTPDPDPIPTITATLPPVVGQMTATVGVPDNALAEVRSLVPTDGNASVITVALAVVGVAGGGAAIKLYRDMVKSKHDEKMKALEIEQQRGEKKDDQHGKCSAERASLEARLIGVQTQIDSTVVSLNAIKARLDEVGAHLATHGGDGFDPEEFAAWRAKVDKALKPAKGTR